MTAGQFDARVLQFKGKPPGWVLVILERDTGFIRDGFESLNAEGLVFEGGYATSPEARNEAENFLSAEGVEVNRIDWSRIEP